MLGEKIVDLSQFQKEEEIENTPFIHVYKGIDTKTNEPVALNEYSADKFNSQIQMKFLNRIQTLSKIAYPTVEQLVGFTLPTASKSEPPTIVTKFMNNGTLKSVATGQYFRFTPSQQMKLMYGIASGLKYLHNQGIVHGSLDISKISINDKFEPLIIGVSSYENDNDQFDIYKAPEMYTPGNTITEKADIYSFAFICYFILFGDSSLQNSFNSIQSVLQGQRPPVPSNLPYHYQQFFQSCWSTDPSQRPSIDTVLEKLSQPEFDISSGDVTYVQFLEKLRLVPVGAPQDANTYLLLGKQYYTGTGGTKNEHKAAKYFKKAADLGNSCGQFRYGFCLLYGKGVNTDFREAARFFKLSADQNYSYGQLYYGLCLKSGDGVERNPQLAMNYFSMAANNHNLEAIIEIGKCYMKGIGVEKDQSKGAQCYYQAAQEGSVKAIRKFGLCWIKGIGVEANQESGQEFVCKAALYGDVKAQIFIADNLLKHKMYNDAYKFYLLGAQQNNAHCEYKYAQGIMKKRIKDDVSVAREYYRLASEQKHTKAMMKFAGSYLPEDSEKRKEIIQAAAENGNTKAQLLMAQNLQSSNKAQSIAYLEKAAENGDPNAQLQYGIKLLNGDGVQTDKIIGFEYIRMSAQAGNVNATAQLGLCFMNGNGCKKNPKAGAKLLGKAAEAGNVVGIIGYAHCLDQGIGVKKNVNLALNYWSKLVDLGHPEGYYMYGMYLKNGTGIAKNKENARTNLIKAAEMGHPAACLEYGKYLERGDGVKVDMEKAKQMYQFAIDHNVAQAKECMAKLMKKMK